MIRGSLEKHQTTPRLNDAELHDYARKAYQQKNKVLIDITELTDLFFKQMVINYANQKYGKLK